MSWQPQVLLSAASIAIAVIGLLISLFSFYNSRQARLESREASLLNLRLDALTALKEVELGWQDAIGEVVRKREGLVRTNATPVLVTQALADWEATFRESLANAHKMTEACRAQFDTWSADNAARALRESVLNKMTVTQAVAEMRRKFSAWSQPQSP